MIAYTSLQDKQDGYKARAAAAAAKVSSSPASIHHDTTSTRKKSAAADNPASMVVNNEGKHPIDAADYKLASADPPKKRQKKYYRLDALLRDVQRLLGKEECAGGMEE